jgi:hypothetical protein
LSIDLRDFGAAILCRLPRCASSGAALRTEGSFSHCPPPVLPFDALTGEAKHHRYFSRPLLVAALVEDPWMGLKPAIDNYPAL